MAAMKADIERLAAFVAKLEEQRARAGAPLGATGNYPDGMLTPEDQGEIRFGVTADAGRVILAFNDRITWIGMAPQVAVDLANALVHWARNARLQTRRCPPPS